MAKLCSINDVIYFEMFQRTETVRWRLLAECCRLQRNFDTLMADYTSCDIEGCHLEPIEKLFMEQDYEYPTEKK